MSVPGLLPIFVVLINYLILLLNRVWLAIGLLWVQYLLAAIVIYPIQPLRTVVARLVGGTLVSMILYTTQRRFSTTSDEASERSLPRSIWFKAMAALIFTLLGWAFAYQSQSTLDSVQYAVRLSSVLNIALGLVMLGLYQEPIEAAIGLLILLIGFDLFYSSIEPSLAILLLMLALQVIIALATSYIMSIKHQFQSKADTIR
jgi:cytochrome c biogenesis protein CcdA